MCGGYIELTARRRHAKQIGWLADIAVRVRDIHKVAIPKHNQQRRDNTMPQIVIMGLSGDSKVLPMTATKTEIVDAILKTAKEDKTEETPTEKGN